jgi:hypothetical protein
MTQTLPNVDPYVPETRPQAPPTWNLPAKRFPPSLPARSESGKGGGASKPAAWVRRSSEDERRLSPQSPPRFWGELWRTREGTQRKGSDPRTAHPHHPRLVRMERQRERQTNQPHTRPQARGQLPQTHVIGHASQRRTTPPSPSLALTHTIRRRTHARSHPFSSPAPGKNPRPRGGCGIVQLRVVDQYLRIVVPSPSPAQSP